MAKKNNVAQRSVTLKDVKLDSINDRLVLVSEELDEPIDFISIVEQFVGCVVDFSIIQNVVIFSNADLHE